MYTYFYAQVLAFTFPDFLAEADKDDRIAGTIGIEQVSCREGELVPPIRDLLKQCKKCPLLKIKAWL